MARSARRVAATRSSRARRSSLLRWRTQPASPHRPYRRRRVPARRRSRRCRGIRRRPSGRTRSAPCSRRRRTRPAPQATARRPRRRRWPTTRRCRRTRRCSSQRRRTVALCFLNELARLAPRLPVSCCLAQMSPPSTSVSVFHPSLNLRSFRPALCAEITCTYPPTCPTSNRRARVSLLRNIRLYILYPLPCTYDRPTLPRRDCSYISTILCSYQFLLGAIIGRSYSISICVCAACSEVCLSSVCILLGIVIQLLFSHLSFSLPAKRSLRAAVVFVPFVHMRCVY